LFLQPDLSLDVSCCRYFLNRSTEKLLRLKQTAEKSSKRSEPNLTLGLILQDEGVQHPKAASDPYS
jgi:hypothetical protein